MWVGGYVQVLMETKRGLSGPLSCEQPDNGCRELNLGSMLEQYLNLTAERPLQRLAKVLYSITKLSTAYRTERSFVEHHFP